MLPPLLYKTIIVIFLLLILASLTSGLYYLIRDRGMSDRTVKALTVRIGLSLTLFFLLIIGFATGVIQPGG
ncbi:MAG: twin transmembrane helix small protein [Gammaproteobacteria bacterium]